MARQFIYHMQGLTKTYPGGNRRSWRTSTCRSTRTPRSACSASTARASRRCCASWPASTRSSPARAGSPRARASATCSRSRSSTRRKTCASNVMEGVAPQEGDARPLQRNRDELLGRDRGRDDEAAGRDRRQGPVGPRLQGRAGDGRAALPAGRRRRGRSSRAASAAASRSASCCSSSPNCCCSTSRPTISTPKTVAWLEGHLRNYPGAILIVTHDRYFLDNVTGWILELDRGRGIPYEGNYSSWLEQKQKRLAQEGREDEARQRTLAREQEWIAAVAAGAAGEVQGAHQRYEELRRSRPTRRRPQTAQIVIPVGRAARAERRRVRGPQEGLRRQAADRRPHLQAAARRHRRRHRPERRRQDHAVPHDHRAGEARRRHDQASARSVQLGYVDQSPRRARRQEERLGGDLRRPRHHPCSASAR